MLFGLLVFKVINCSRENGSSFFPLKGGSEKNGTTKPTNLVSDLILTMRRIPHEHSFPVTILKSDGRSQQFSRVYFWHKQFAKKGSHWQRKTQRYRRAPSFYSQASVLAISSGSFWRMICERNFPWRSSLVQNSGKQDWRNGQPPRVWADYFQVGLVTIEFIFHWRVTRKAREQF